MHEVKEGMFVTFKPYHTGRIATGKVKQLLDDTTALVLVGAKYVTVPITSIREVKGGGSA